MRDVGTAADEAAPKGSGFFSGMAQVAGGFLAANVIGNIAGQLKSFVSDGIADAQKSRELLAATENIIKNTGRSGEISAQQVADLASSLSDAAGKSLFGDDQIQGAENVILKFKELKVPITDVTKLSLDMAQTLGADPAAAADTLGRALQKPEDAAAKLAKMGIVLTDQQKEMIKTMVAAGDTAGAQAYLMEQLNGTFAGSAQSAAESAGGMVQFKARIGEAGESVGAALLPVLNMLAGVLNDYVAPALETGIPIAIDAVKAAIASVAPVFDYLAQLFSGAGEQSNEFSGILADLGAMWGLVADIIALNVQLVTDVVIPAFKEIAGFLQAHSAEIGAVLSAAWTIIKTIITVALAVIKGVITVVMDVIKGDWSGAWEAIKTMCATIVEGMIAILTADLEILKTVFGGAIQWINDAWQALPGQLANVGAAIVQSIKDGIEGEWNKLVSWFNDKLQELKDKLPFSEPKDASSPLAGLSRAGAGIVTQIQAGIRDADPLAVGAPLIGGARGTVAAPSSSASGGGGQTVHIVLDAGEFKKLFKITIEEALTSSGNKSLSRMRTGN